MSCDEIASAEVHQHSQFVLILFYSYQMLIFGNLLEVYRLLLVREGWIQFILDGRR